MDNAFTCTVPMRGDLRIVVRRADTGAVHWKYEIRNTITYVALRGLVNLIAQKSTLDPLDYQVKYLRAGTNATPPTRTDTNLLAPAGTPVHTMEIIDAAKTLTTTNPFELKVVATLGTGDLNGETLREAGLFTRGGAAVSAPGEYPTSSGYYPELFARQVHPEVAKSAAFVVDYDWRISFTS